MTLTIKGQQEHKKLNVTHLIPYDCIGGVEIAAKTMTNISNKKINFNVEFIFSDSAIKKGSKAFYNPLYIIKSAYKIKKQKTDILIVSLWRSYAVGILAKLLSPDLKLITFLHLSKDVHIVDYTLSRLSGKLSEKIWADSQATKKNRFPEKYHSNIEVISFLIHPHKALLNRPPQPNFIFWGRLHPQKNIEHSLFIFSEVIKKIPKANFYIIGPDNGSLKKITSQINNLHLNNSVHLLGEKNFKEIEVYANNASFYLQTSHDEGMAMSVIEAMQLGLVPVVTPVGEIASYCIDGENALIINTDNIIDRIIELLNNPEEFHRLSKKSTQKWSEQESYQSSVISNLIKL